MKSYRELELYLNDSSNEVRVNFYRQCFNIVNNDKFNYNDEKNTCIDGFYLDNCTLVYYANTYFINFANESERKQFLDNPLLCKQFQIREEYFKLETYEEKLAYVYKWCLDLNWSFNKLIPVAMALHITSDNTRRRGIKYAINYLNIPKSKMKDMLEEASLINKREYYNNSKYNDIFRRIYIEEDINKVVDILERNKVSVSDMLPLVSNYVKLYKNLLDNNKSDQEIIDCLISKIKYYSNYRVNKNAKIREEEKKRKVEAREKSLLTIANMHISTLAMFILQNQGMSNLEGIEREFCKCMNIEYKTLKNYKKVVEKNNKELFIEYFYASKVVNDLREKQILITVLKLKNILLNDCLYKKTFNNPRPKFKFNSIDYYRIFDIPLDELYKGVDNANIGLCVDDIKLIKYFAHPYYLKMCYKLDSRTLKSILNSVKESRCEKDEKGFPIRGTGIVLSRDEKVQIWDYLTKNNIPGINVNVYNDACEKYMDDDLFEFGFKTRKLK